MRGTLFLAGVLVVLGAVHGAPQVQLIKDGADKSSLSFLQGGLGDLLKASGVQAVHLKEGQETTESDTDVDSVINIDVSLQEDSDGLTETKTFIIDTRTSGNNEESTTVTAEPSEDEAITIVLNPEVEQPENNLDITVIQTETDASTPEVTVTVVKEDPTAAEPSTIELPSLPEEETKDTEQKIEITITTTSEDTAPESAVEEPENNLEITVIQTETDASTPAVTVTVVKEDPTAAEPSTIELPSLPEEETKDTEQKIEITITSSEDTAPESVVEEPENNLEITVIQTETDASTPDVTVTVVKEDLSPAEPITIELPSLPEEEAKDSAREIEITIITSTEVTAPVSVVEQPENNLEITVIQTETDASTPEVTVTVETEAEVEEDESEDSEPELEVETVEEVDTSAPFNSITINISPKSEPSLSWWKLAQQQTPSVLVVQAPPAQVNYVQVPAAAPWQYVQAPQVQYVSQPANQLQYVSQPQVQYVSQPAAQVQYVQQPAAQVQYLSQPQVQYVAASSPQVQYVTQPASNVVLAATTRPASNVRVISDDQPLEDESPVNVEIITQSAEQDVPRRIVIQ